MSEAALVFYLLLGVAGLVGCWLMWVDLREKHKELRRLEERARRMLGEDEER